VDLEFPAKPPESLPIFAIAQDNHGAEFPYSHPSLAVMRCLVELCDNYKEGFPCLHYAVCVGPMFSNVRTSTERSLWQTSTSVLIQIATLTSFPFLQLFSIFFFQVLTSLT
jgi:hypothetical protein